MPTPADTKPSVEEEFDLLAFWLQYKNQILLLLGLLVFGLVAYATFELVQHRGRESAARDLANAKIAEDFRRVASGHEGQPAAGDALLLLADKLRKDGKLDESSAALREFIDKYPNHPLVSGAWMSLGVNLELQEKADEALANYQRIVASYPTSFSAPGALMAQARILKAKGKTEEAKRAYENVIAQFPENVHRRLAEIELQQLKKQ
jgi:TolA-binding protein